MNYEIDEIRKVKLGGVIQKIHIRGEKKTNPVLLFLHGGPGVTNRHGVLARHSDLCDAFTIVCWDQRGTGGSYWGVKDESLNPINELLVVSTIFTSTVLPTMPRTAASSASYGK